MISRRARKEMLRCSTAAVNFLCGRCEKCSLLSCFSVAPYMVNTFNRNNQEYLSVDNTAMMYMLINAVKEQQEQIEALKKKLAEMEKK